MRSLCVLCHKVHDDFNWQYAPYETEYGVKYGYFCHKWFKPSKHEWIPERIKKDRAKYFNTLVQPWRAGVPSQEFIDAHGTKNFTKDEVKKARMVWSEIPGHATRKKSL
jgi:hypothetical protein